MDSDFVEIWDTPFKEDRDPSVGLITENGGETNATLVVAPNGLDVYPKFLVRFSGVLAASYCEEAGAIVSLGQEYAPKDFCCYLWRSSPQVDSYRQIIFYAELDLRHYIIFGGDNIASVVCTGEPIIEEVSSPTEIAVTYAI
ncbi:hypothetical protein [Dokdonella immobilis]|uniref:Uncharacterized protein n=1 Tax=Dokdonella immobilis TaxID=578942 RepID=A0A1I4YJ08_9GAMM|nr:hypothetical protein [Dokdonella immobilis]SFN37590.1 hypothetical protein SAMN05216289_11784 [Dokdonella immobilis]